MLPRTCVRAPTSGPVPDSLRLPTSGKSLLKSLLRLSKPSLIELALEWLQEENQAISAPYLASNRRPEEEVDEDYLWTPAETIEELRLTYNGMRYEIGVGKRHIIDRILDGDWRRGLSLYQVATVDFQYLSENDKALRWTALKLVPQGNDEDIEQESVRKKRKTNASPYPMVSASTFLRNLEYEISPLVKAHYHLHQTDTPQELQIIRICVADSPYTNPQSSDQSSLLFTDPNRVIFIALPGSCPYIYVSVSGHVKDAAITKKKTSSARMDITSLKRIVLEGIPKAISKPQHRYVLESTSLTARSLSAMMSLRGNSGTNTANGVYTIFAKGIVDNSPIDSERPTFGQKILQACHVEEHGGHSQNLPELSVRPLQQTDQRTALVERSTDLAVARTAKSEQERIGLKIAAATRFGVADLPQQRLRCNDQNPTITVGGLDRLQFRLDEDLFSGTSQAPFSVDHPVGQHDVDPSDETSALESSAGNLPKQCSARMTLTFQGSNIFFGIRKLVEAGVIAVEKLPAWMTGEEAVSGGTVRRGIVVLGKGAGA